MSLKRLLKMVLHRMHTPYYDYFYIYPFYLYKEQKARTRKKGMTPVKFSCEKSLLIEAVTAVARAVPQKSAVQVLEGILLRCGDGKLSLTGYDLDIGIESSIEASVQEEGAVVLNARMLSEIVRKLPGSSVSVV